MRFYPQYLAEFIGTFFLVFFGCGSMILAEILPGYPGQFVPIVWGGIVTVMIYGVGHISGAHFNPAVTLSFSVVGRFPKNKIIGYLGSQFLGALFASFIHMLIWGKDHSFGMTDFEIPLVVALLVEFGLSFLLMFIILSVATDSRAVGELAGLAIGLTIALCAMVGGPLTKASMNPARSFAPAIFTDEYTQLWVYLFITILGAISGALVYEKIRCLKEDGEDAHGCC